MPASRPRAEHAFPRPRADLIARPRLLTALDSALDAGALLVTAPAGYGKTTLLAQWLDLGGLQVAWLTVTSRHRDAMTLFADIASALPRPASDAPGRATGSRGHAKPLDVSRLHRELGTAIEQVDGVLALVLDDLHCLEGAPEALALIDTLVATPPANLHLCLLSRERPALPSWPLAAARGHVATLEATGLACSEDEADALLRALDVPTETRAAIVQRAAGWPAALAVLGRGFDARTGAPRHTADEDLGAFIAGEVLGALDAGERALLEACAILPRIDRGLAEQLVGAGGDLRGLASRQQLLAPLTGEWFVLHDTLRDVVITELQERDPTRLRELRRQAGAALERRGDLRGAFELTLAAADEAGALRIALPLAGELYQRGEWTTLCACLDALDPARLAGAPELYLLRARVASKLQRPVESLAMLEALDSALLQPAEALRRAIYIATALRQARRFEDALPAYRRARQLGMEHEPAGSPLLAELELEEGIALGMAGHLEAARSTLERAVEAAEACGERRLAADAYQNLGMALMQSGDLARAMTAHEAARARWALLDDPEGLLLTRNNLATAQHLLGDLETALAGFEEVRRGASELGLPRLVGLGLVGVADIERDRGQRESAAPRYAEALAIGERLSHGTLVAPARFGLAMVHRERGELDHAWSLLEHGYATAREQSALEWSARFAAGSAAVLLERGQIEDALERLRAAEAAASEAGARRALTSALLLRARAEHALGRTRAAGRTLARVAAGVRSLGYDQFLVTETRRAPELLKFASGLPRVGATFAALDRRARHAAPGAALEANEPPAAHGLAVRALGAPRVRASGASEDLEWRSERSLELLLYLLHEGRPRPRAEIAFALWPDLEPARLGSMFHSTVYRLRRTVGAEAVIHEAGGYALNPDLPIDYDVTAFERALDAALLEEAGSEVSMAQLRGALDRYSGPFAAGLESEWAAQLRDRLGRRFATAALDLARTAIARERYVEASWAAEAAARADPLDEEAARHLIAARIGEGRPDLARDAYLELRAALRRDLDISPAPETARLMQTLMPRAATSA